MTGLSRAILEVAILAGERAAPRSLRNIKRGKVRKREEDHHVDWGVGIERDRVHAVGGRVVDAEGSHRVLESWLECLLAGWTMWMSLPPSFARRS